MVSDTPRRPSELIRFGVFEVNLETGELRKSGIRLRLQTQPFKILAVLLRRPGEVVSREEVQRELWGADTNVDFEHGLGTAISKLRDALGDSPRSPRYIETLARHGYRFIAPVTVISSTPEVPVTVQTRAVIQAPTRAPRALEPIVRERRFASHWRLLILGAAILAFSAAAVVSVRSRTYPSELFRVQQLTWSGRVYPGSPRDEAFANVVTDSVRLYFRVLDGGEFSIASAPLAGDEINSPIQRISTPADIASPTLDDISADGSKLLVGDHSWAALEWPLWLLPSAGGVAHRVSNVYAHDATWMPDGRILYAFGHDLWVTKEGQSPEVYAHLPGRGYQPRWSPDGSRLRLTIVDAKTRVMSLWEVNANSRKPVPVFQDTDSVTSHCCGNWTADGRSFFFQKFGNGISDIWMEHRAGFTRTPIASQITAGPLQYLAPVSSGRGRQLFVIGSQSHTRLNRFDLQTHHFATYLPALSTAGRFAISPDRTQLAWISTNDGSLWRSPFDGTQRLQLTSPPFEVFMMTWSPDGQHLAIMGKHPGEPWKLYTIPMQGGDLNPLVKDDRNQADPSWSPDGRYIAFGRTPEYMGEEGTRKAISILDMTTKSVKELPGSTGLFSPRWSPDGRCLAALPLDQQKLMLYDFATGRWSVVAKSSVDNPVWTEDSKYLYFDAFMEQQKSIYRVCISDKRVEHITNIRDVDPAGNLNYAFVGLSNDGMPVVSVDRWTADIFSVQRAARPILK